MCTGLIGHCLSYDWCYGSPGTLCTGLIGHCFLIFGATGRLALYVYGADWALFSYIWCYGSPGTLCVRG